MAEAKVYRADHFCDSDILVKREDDGRRIIQLDAHLAVMTISGSGLLVNLKAEALPSITAEAVIPTRGSLVALIDSLEQMLSDWPEEHTEDIDPEIAAIFGESGTEASDG